MNSHPRIAAAVLAVPVLATAIGFILTAFSGSSSASSSPKIASRVLKETASGNSTEALIVLSEQADLSGAASLPTKQAKGRYVVNALRAVAARTQAASFEGKSLLVQVPDTAWRQQLQQLSPQYVQALRSMCGEEIETIKFVVGTITQP